MTERYSARQSLRLAVLLAVSIASAAEFPAPAVEQKRVAEAYIQQLDKAGVFPRPIVTLVAPLAKFQGAAESQQHFVDRNPNSPYVVSNDLPKLKHLQQQFPELLKHR